MIDMVDDRDAARIAKIRAIRALSDELRVGDFVRFPSGELERVSYDHSVCVQTSPLWSGSIHLRDNGHGSYSGAMNPGVPAMLLRRTSETMMGAFWFFHHGIAGAGRGVRFEIPCAVYETDAAYNNYITQT